MPEVASASDSGRCLSEDDMLRFASGQLSSAQRERAHRHLDGCEDCQQLLNEAVHALATARTADSAEHDEPAWSTTFRPGMLVGRRYIIRRFIARGGMGEVYEAFDQDLQQRVALKTVTSTACDNPSAVRRLKAEVQLARRVSHPNVCRIYDFGTHQAATTSPPISFLTMEYVEGETLGLRLRRSGALPVAEAVHLGRALLRGLAAAHAAGVLHRDFKSDNVLLRRDGDRFEPLILDFGLARAFDHVNGQSSNSGHGLVGTLAYMAPDQLEGQPYTTASDVYSFGLVWFEMLTGELPFKARSSPAVTTLERLTKAVPSPSSMNPLVTRDLDTVVSACLRRSMRDRLQTAADVLHQLNELERHVGAPRPKPRPATALIVTGLAITGGALALLANSVEPLPARTSLASAARRAAASTTPVVSAPPTPSAPVAAPTPPPARERVKPAGLPSAKRTRPAISATSPRPMTPAEHGWENPFGASALPESNGLGAVLKSTVLHQSGDGSAPAGNSELPKGAR